jgi:hypothetical protein
MAATAATAAAPMSTHPNNGIPPEEVAAPPVEVNTIAWLTSASFTVTAPDGGLAVNPVTDPTLNL